MSQDKFMHREAVRQDAELHRLEAGSTHALGKSLFHPRNLRFSRVSKNFPSVAP